ncbi:Uncharacterised protein [Bordetella holmesii]|nr:Uncharacterised protein [Bordetella holmesii]
MNSIVSAETVSWFCRGGSSSPMAGRSLSPAGGANRLCCFSFSARSERGTTVMAGSMRTGCSCTSFSCLATTCSVRTALATSPTLRSSRAAYESRTRRTRPSSQLPTRSAICSHENEKNRLRPTASSTSRARVPPVKPTPRDSQPASIWPITPPAPLSPSVPPGRCMPQLYRRSASMPSEQVSRSTKPMPSSQCTRGKASGCLPLVTRRLLARRR